MRKTQDLDDWQGFEAALRTLYDERRRLQARGKDLFPLFRGASPLLFRGQSNADWPLATTLERFRKPDLLRAVGYYDTIYSAKPEIETYTGKRWEIPVPHDYAARFNDAPLFARQLFEGEQIYEYTVYLRHHGFPSPLLDWSRSPYVAAFFAMRDPPPGAERVAIYAFLEYASGAKVTVGGLPTISGVDPYVAGHRRHFQQQSQYTVCTIDVGDGAPRYGSHQEAFVNADGDQDILWKFRLPVSQRMDVLRTLDLYNINAFSLFGSEESLMDTMAMRELIRE